MALKKTRLTGIISITGAGVTSAVGIVTGGVTSTPVGVASTCYVKGVIIHNPTSIASAVQLHFVENTTPISGTANTNTAFYKQTIDALETQLFELTYPMVLTPNDSISVTVGVGSTANFMILGDTEVIS